jgi:CheY-like chemotaxis protein
MGPPRILVIDDETEIREAIAQALTLDGYDVETALDGREGATLVCRNPYDLIFCDLRMPEMDGRGLYKEIQRLCPRVLKRLVFVTALARSPDYGPFLHDTGTQVLAKPFTIPQLRAVVARMVGPEILRRAETASVFLRENDRHAH